MIKISNLTNCGVTDLMDQTNFTGGHTHLSKITFFCEQLCSPTCRTDHLTTTSLFDFDVMDQSADGDIGDREGIPGTDFGPRASHDHIANFEIHRCDNVALLAIHINQQRKSGCAVRVILNRGHFRRNIALITFEINNADKAAMTTTAMTNCHASIRITTATLTEWYKQGTFRLRFSNFFKAVTGHVARARSYRFIFFYGHYCTPSKI